VNCGYHYTPKQHFADNGMIDQRKNHRRSLIRKHLERAPKPISQIPFETFRQSLTGYAENAFVQYLCRLFGVDTASQLIKQFYIGTSDHWRGATVFWQIDFKGCVRSGKIMLYDTGTGRRVKEVQPDGGQRSLITWAHSLLQKQKVIRDFNLRQCIFGEHQLTSRPKTTPVAVVESEKTAIIAAAYLPDLVWLACGSSTNLKADKCRVLEGRRVILFPDLNCFDKWTDKAKHLRTLLDCNIIVSNLLESGASEAERAGGLDLADFLVRNELACPAGIGE
jgi:hypothetical protein